MALSMCLRLQQVKLPVLLAGRRTAGGSQVWKQNHTVRKPLSANRRVSSSTTEDRGEVKRAREANLARQHLSSQEPTIFSKILSREIPADIIHEDEMVIYN